MTAEQQKKFYDLAMRCVREDKKEQMEGYLAEAIEKQAAGEFTKKYLTDVGMRMLAIVQLSRMTEFISSAKKLASEMDVQI